MECCNELFYSYYKKKKEKEKRKEKHVHRRITLRYLYPA